MAQLQESISGIVAAFYLCTRSDGSRSPLSREELRQLIEQEFADAMENPQDPKAVNKVLCFLGDDSNCRVDFRELLSLVFRVAKACYKPPEQGQELEDEPRAQEKAGGEQPLEPSALGRVLHNQQVPQQVQDAGTLELDDHQTQETETHDDQIQNGEISKQDQDTHQTKEDETPEQDQDIHQGYGNEASEGDQERDEILDTATPEQHRNTLKAEETETPTPEQDRNTLKAEETETPEQDPKTYQAQETQSPGQGSNHPLSPEMDSQGQDLNCPSEPQGRDPKSKTQVYEGSWQDPNPNKTQNLPPEKDEDSHQGLNPQGTHNDLIFHPLLEHSRAEALSYPAQHQREAHHQTPPTTEQQLLQSLYRWPPQQ